jgi:predicted PurR-regulated permease PerM
MTSQDTRTTARRTVTVIGVVLAALVLVLIVYETRRALIWLLVAVFFAVALHPAVSVLERRISWCPRWLATLMVFLFAFLALAAVVAAMVTPLVREASALVDQFPRLADDVRAGRGPLGALVERFRLREYIAEHSEQIREYASRLTAPTVAILRGALTTIAGLVTIFVLAYLLVLQGPQLTNSALDLVDERPAARIRRVGKECARTVTGYLTGNLLISVIAGTLTYITLKIVGVPYAGLIAVFVAIMDLIPLVGATLGALVAVGAGFLHSTTAGIVVLVFFIVYQQLENHLLQPLIFSRTVRLSPLAVLIAILFGVELAGILGALLAIPVAGIIKILVRDFWDARRDRPLIGADEPPAPIEPPGPPGPALEAR